VLQNTNVLRLIVLMSCSVFLGCQRSTPQVLRPAIVVSAQMTDSGLDAGGEAQDLGVFNPDSMPIDIDTGILDAGVEFDLGIYDAGTTDANAPDGTFDTGIVDAMAPDAEPLDSGVGDLGWRSDLYPDNWTPSFQSAAGHRLHDFSYAGYKNGAEAIGQPVNTTVYNVVTDFQADNTGQSDCTSQVQAAVDAAIQNGGGIVQFPAGDFRFDSSISINASNIVFRGDGHTNSRLFFTSHSGLSYQSHITFRGNLQQSDEQLLSTSAAAYQNELEVADASAFAIGDDVVVGWIITNTFISDHQMTGTWDHATNAFKYTWQPFFRRQVSAVDTQSTPNTITLDVPLRYPALRRDSASIKKETGYLEEVGVEQLSLGNAVAWSDAWSENQIHVLEFRGVKDSWIRNVHSFDPPTGPSSGRGRDDHLQSGGILVRYAKRVTVADSEMHGAQNKGGGGNGYIFEVRQSSEILFRDLSASKGRHNFIQNWGFGTSGCVWLRVHSALGNAWLNASFPGLVGYSEFHHSLAMANLIDQSHFDDGWSIVNRGNYSSYSGHTGTENVMWNTGGNGNLRSRQFGLGYVIGTKDIRVETSVGLLSSGATGTAPEDYTEGLNQGDDLYPQSLYEDQLMKRGP